MDQKQELVLISLGSNLGEKISTLRAALQRLEQFARGPVRISSFWASEPVDCPPGSPDFVNAAASFEPKSDLKPADLLDALQALEKECGRGPKTVLNEARPLDLDIILWGNLTVETDRLSIPHPRATSRRFVLEPLAELAPELQWPGSLQTIAELRDTLVNSSQQIRRLDSASPIS